MGGKIVKEALVGKYVNLREVRIEDADFILQLRCDEKKSKFLHKTEYDLQKQEAYIKHYFEIPDEWYFIAEDKNANPIGTYRIYDIQGDSFCIGSWLMIDGITAEQSFETDYLVRMYGFNVLGFEKMHFQVSKGNNKVFRYHKILGATVTSENDIEYELKLEKNIFLEKSKKLLQTI